MPQNSDVVSSAQAKITSAQDYVNSIQSQIDDVQRQIDDAKSNPIPFPIDPPPIHWPPWSFAVIAAPSVSRSLIDIGGEVLFHQYQFDMFSLDTLSGGGALSLPGLIIEVSDHRPLYKSLRRQHSLYASSGPFRVQKPGQLRRWKLLRLL
jgi:hypothetical protein